MPLLEASVRGAAGVHAPVLPVSVQLAPKLPSGLEPLAAHTCKKKSIRRSI